MKQINLLNKKHHPTATTLLWPTFVTVLIGRSPQLALNVWNWLSRFSRVDKFSCNIS